MSQWLHVRIKGQVSWPEKETSIDFGGYKFVLLPYTAEYCSSIHCALTAQNLNREHALDLINQMLSLTSWCDKAHITTDGSYSVNSGQPIPQKHYKKGVSKSPTWPFKRSPLTCSKSQLALALYREAKQLWVSNGLTYATLGFAKIINIGYNKGDEQIKWMRKTIPLIEDNLRLEQKWRDELNHSAKAKGWHDWARYIYEEARCAVAHAHKENAINPDKTEQVKHLSICGRIYEELAKYYIKNELGVSDCWWGTPNDEIE